VVLPEEVKEIGRVSIWLAPKLVLLAVKFIWSAAWVEVLTVSETVRGTTLPPPVRDSALLLLSQMKAALPPQAPLLLNNTWPLLVPPRLQPPAGELVAITLPFWSTAKNVEVKALPKDNWEMVVVAKVDVPVTAKVPPTVKMLLIVVLPVTDRVLEVLLKVKLVEVPMMLFPWPNKMSLAVRFWSWMVGAVPPLERMEPLPLTAVTPPAEVVVAIILPLASTAKTAEVKPLPRESWEIVVVARVDVPVTDKDPPTVKRLEIVVDPVTAKVLEVELKVKLVLVPMMLFPCPNNMSLAVRFWSWRVGVLPPEESIEPEPFTAVTPPAEVVVAITLPLASTAKIAELSPAMVVKPLKVAEPDTVREESVDVPADSGPVNVPLPKFELPCTVRLPETAAADVTRELAERSVKPEILPTVKLVLPEAGT
jgi:hypothetical protein